MVCFFGWVLIMVLLTYINVFFLFSRDLEQLFTVSFSGWLYSGVNGNTNAIIFYFLGSWMILGLFFTVGLLGGRVVILMAILTPLFFYFFSSLTVLRQIFAVSLSSRCQCVIK